MNRILIVGLKDPAGGVESSVMECVRHFNSDNIIADFAVFGHDFSLEKEIKKLGGKVIYLPSRTKKHLQYKKYVKNILDHGNYSAVWCNFSGLTNIDFLKAAKKTGVPLRIAHAHTSMFAWGNILMKYLVPLMHFKNQKKIDNYANVFWACSPAAASFMFGEKLSQKAEFIKNSVDTEKYRRSEECREEVRSEFGVKDCPVIIHVGRMCVAKNQKFMLEIFAEVLQKLPEAKLLFVGDGELHQEIVDYVKTLRLEAGVIFAGARTDVPRLLQGADAFLLPSVTEGFPVTLVEAQAAGLCCVTSKGVVPENTDVTGNVKFLSLEEDVEKWAETVISATGNYIANGFEKVVASGYDSKANAKEIENFFMRGQNL